MENESIKLKYLINLNKNLFSFNSKTAQIFLVFFWQSSMDSVKI